MTVDKDLASVRDSLTGGHSGRISQGLRALARVEAELSRLREQRDALRADYGDALKEVDELLDLMDAGREHIEPHDPIAPFLSAGWQCPVCDRRGNLHDERCLVLEIAAVARRRKNGNRRLVVTNGRLRARAEAAEARCARLQRQLDAVDAHLPPWEMEPGSDVGCVGRVQTILNLRADRERCARLRGKLEWVKHALPPSVSDELTEWLDEEAS